MSLKKLGILLVLLLAACSSAGSPTLTPVPTDVPAAPVGEGGALAAVVQEAGLPDDRPNWHSFTLTNARNGQMFTLLAFGGKTIYVQPMAVACQACVAQLEQVRAARARLSADDYVFLAVSADPAAALGAFADQNGYDWVFVTAGVDFFAGMVATFGENVSALETTPHFLISPAGAVSTLSNEVDSADELIAQLSAASGA